MKVKQFVLFQLKAWLPMIIAIGALVVTSTLIVGLNAEPYINVIVSDSSSYISYRLLYQLNRSPVSCIALMMIPSMLAACVMPFFAYSHRYGKTRADCFLSLPVKNGKISQTRILLMGAILLAFYLTAYLFGSIGAILKQIVSMNSASATVNAYSEYVESFSAISGSFGWYFLAWPLGAVVVMTFYFINCFLIGQGSNVLQGVVALIAGHIVLCLLIPVTIYVPGGKNYNADWMEKAFGYGYSFFDMPAFYVPMVLIEGTVGTLEKNMPNCWESCIKFLSGSHWSLWVGSVSFLLLGGGALTWILLGKDPGGEFAGENRPRNFFATLLPHLAFLTCLLGEGVFMTALFSYGSGVFFILEFTNFIWTGGLYYVVLSLYNHSFKLDLKNWMMYAGVNVTSLFAMILSASISGF